MSRFCLKLVLSLFLCPCVLLALSVVEGVFLCPFVFSEEINLDPIIVSSSRLNQTVFNSLRATGSLDYREMKSIPAVSVSDLLQYFPSVDIRRRGAGGMQADLSIRGANFQQTAVLLDGIAINDPQTGHFNMDVPISLLDIERIEVLRGQASSLYGPNAFAGCLNIITKKPLKKKAVYEYSRGEYNLTRHAFSLNLPLGEFFSGASYDYKQSASYKPETEFIQRNFSASLYRQLENSELNISGGVMDKDFGASTFYSNLFPREEEHIRTSFGRLSLRSDNYDAALYYRRHWDNFLLDRTRPGWNENTHTTYIYGGQFQKRENLGFLNLVWGLDLAQDKITSTSLGRHGRNREALFLELGRIWEEKYIFNLGLREDYYSDWGGEFSPNLDLGYVINQDLKLCSSLGRSFRVPSFTELYYRDAGNIGNENLAPEYNLSWEIGLDKKQDTGLFGLTFFRRRTIDAIDWVRENTSQAWQAQNSGRIYFEGVELEYKFINTDYTDLENRLHRLNKIFSLERAGYTYMESDRKDNSAATLSKYALDHLRHQFILGAESVLPWGFAARWNLSYKKRINSAGWFILDSRISREISKDKFKYEIFLEVTNLTNANYKEISDVASPGRWLIFGVKTEF